MHRSRYVVALVSAAGLAAAALLAPPAASAGGAPITPIASGFAGPLHVAFGPGHSLYVADAFAGAVVKVDLRTGAKKSYGVPGFGPGVDVNGNGNVMVSATFGAGGEGSQSPTGLLRYNAAGKSWHAADLLAFEIANNPDGQEHNDKDAWSNPYSVLALGSRTIVADAAANDLVSVSADGKASLLTAFPLITTGACEGRPNNDPEHAGCDPVPTDVELGPDGYLYVSGLGAEVEGHIYKVDASTGAIVRTWGELPPLTGIAVAADGTIYAASLFTNQVFRFSGGSAATASVPAPLDVELGHGMVVVSSFTGSVFSVAPSAFS